MRYSPRGALNRCPTVIWKLVVLKVYFSRPKSALYLKLKKRKVCKKCPGSFYEKLRKQFQDTQSVPFMLDKTRKLLFPLLETKKVFSLGKCRIMSKTLRGPLCSQDFSFQVKVEGASIETNWEKRRMVPKKRRS